MLMIPCYPITSLIRYLDRFIALNKLMPCYQIPSECTKYNFYNYNYVIIARLL